MADGYVVNAKTLAKATRTPPDVSGAGYLAGEFPDGITTVGGVPVAATVLVRLRKPGHPHDGALVAVTESLPDGTWRVDGLNTALRFDVVGRKDGHNDVIVAGVTPKT